MIRYASTADHAGEGTSGERVDQSRGERSQDSEKREVVDQVQGREESDHILDYFFEFFSGLMGSKEGGSADLYSFWPFVTSLADFGGFSPAPRGTLESTI